MKNIFQESRCFVNILINIDKVGVANAQVGQYGLVHKRVKSIIVHLRFYYSLL